MKQVLLSAGALLLVTQPVLAASTDASTTPSGEGRDVLPSTFRPGSYDLRLSPDAAGLTFAGEVKIDGEAPATGRVIVLNAKGLTFDSVRLDDKAASVITYDTKLSLATLKFAAPFAAGRHTLSIAYHGAMPKDATLGLFAMDYDTASGPRRTIATNLEPADARSVFPCWDEPGLKATFTLAIDAPADRMALSNMPQVSSMVLPDGRRRVRFAPSPRMSTYLFFAGIGDFERIHRDVDGIDLGVVVKRGDTARAAYALDQGAALLRYYNAYFGVRYPLPKLDLIAAPGEIAGGSMENWGAILYSQEHLLLDPVHATEGDRQLVFEVVAHEMAHQWFGDLVTMDWWDNLWLNEGFARWMQTHAADALHPEWKTGLQAADIFERGKRADASAATHPVLQQVRSAEQATQAFDNITYDKGAAIITMLEAYVGQDAFRDGVRRYMKAHAYGNTVDSDLWSDVQAVAGRPVLAIERDLTRQPGVPLIRAVPDAGGVQLTEDRFAEDPTSLKGQPGSSWRLPLTVAPAKGPAIELLLPQQARAAGDAPLINAGGLTYARVAYTPAHAASLATRMATFAPMDQLNLMNDAWALGQSGYAPAFNLTAFMAALPVDADPVVWRRAVALLVQIDGAMAGDNARTAWRKWAINLISPVAARWENRHGANDGATADALRSDLWAAQAQLGDTSAIMRARHVFSSNSGTPAEQRAALNIVGQSADEPMFDVLLAKARAVSDPLDRLQILSAMARTTNPVLARRMVGIALGPDAPAGSAPKLLGAVGQRNPDAVWAGLQARLTAGTLPFDQEARRMVFPWIASFSASAERIADIRAYGVKDMPPEARCPVEAAVGSIRLNQAVKSGALPDINRWIAAH